MAECFPCGSDAFAEGCCDDVLVERRRLSDGGDAIV